LFLHSPEAVVIDLVVVEVVDMDGVAVVIRLAVVEIIMPDQINMSSPHHQAKK
jgi:hypothetical protein